MADSYLRQHALSHRALDARAALPADAAIRLTLEGPAAQLCLRGDGGRGFNAALKKVLGIAPPASANHVATAGETHILWLGPDEWLAVRPGHDGRDLAADVEAALAGMHALVSDVSHSRAIIGLAGVRAREVLMKGCSLDLDPVAFSPGQCAQTALARGHMLLQQVSDEPGYRVYAQRSFADYAWTWLEDAASEYL